MSSGSAPKRQKIEPSIQLLRPLTTDDVKEQVSVATGFDDQWIIYIFIAWMFRSHTVTFLLELFGIDLLIKKGDNIAGGFDVKTSSRNRKSAVGRHGEEELPRDAFPKGVGEVGCQLMALEAKHAVDFTDKNLHFFFASFQPLQPLSSTASSSSSSAAADDGVSLPHSYLPAVFNDIPSSQHILDVSNRMPSVSGTPPTDKKAAKLFEGKKKFVQVCQKLLFWRIEKDALLAEMCEHFNIQNTKAMESAVILAAHELIQDYRHKTATYGKALHEYGPQDILQKVREQLANLAVKYMDPKTEGESSSTSAITTLTVAAERLRELEAEREAELQAALQAADANYKAQMLQLVEKITESLETFKQSMSKPSN